VSLNTCHIIAGYKFVRLDVLPVLQADLHATLQAAGVLGTVLLADEGINLTLAGDAASIRQARHTILSIPECTDFWFKESHAEVAPFSKLKVKIRQEIIAFDNGQLRPDANPAPNLAPAQLKAWLDEGRKFTLLDTRNQYEVESGTFSQAATLPINTFRDFPSAIAATNLNRDLPIVTFCTGGVRCEKAAPWLIEAGYTQVYQVEGGILNYFEACGDAHWQGECFVFDDRVEIDSTLAATGAVLCTRCHRAVSSEHQQSTDFVPGESCPGCRDTLSLTGTSG